jgi:hypothetical protein
MLNRTVRAPYRRVAERARRWSDHRADREVDRRVAAMGLRPLDGLEPEDVAFVGAVKSGNTWFRYLIAGAIYGIDVRRINPAMLNLLVPTMELHRYHLPLGGPHFVTTHRLPDPEFRRVVYLLRDGRDVMVSLYHHRRALKGDEKVDFLRMVRDGEGLYPCKWHEHVQRWKANPFRADMITVRYEDLLADGVTELQRVCEFIGIERDRPALEAAVTNARFEQMKELESRFGSRIGATWTPDKPFVRRGEAGSFRDEMPPEVLSAFMVDAEDTLRETGYLTD